MKKAKILVPAMGMMLLSTAAAVSGTMAWFSANRAVDVQTTNFAVEAVDGSLTVAALGKVNCSENNSGAYPVVSMAEGHKLADASFDHNSAKEDLYTDVTGDNDAITGFDNLGNLTAATANNTLWDTPNSTIHYGVAFDLTFTYTFKGDNRSLGLFFDLDDSSATVNDGTAYTGEDLTKDHTAKGFRIAFLCGSNRFVWAPNRESTDGVDTLNYVTKETPASGQTYTNCYTAYTAGQIFRSDEGPGSKASEGTDVEHAAHDGYLGKINKSGATGTLTVKCVAWYEGTDPAVVNASTMDAVKTAMKFYVRVSTTPAA